MLPLHFALANEAEGDVVTRLLEAFPEGSKCRDQDGALPLHDASFKGAGVAVVDALIVAYPEGVVQEVCAGGFDCALKCSPRVVAQHNASRGSEWKQISLGNDE